MFSGMFTHCIKPALTLQQAKELFGLLGYKSVSHYEEEELALDSKLLPADFILGLACAFFTARIECQLLLSTLGSVDTSVKSVLQLVKERQKGHSLHLALENTKKKLEAAQASQAKLTGATDSELDLYTDKHSPQASSSSAPPRSYMQSKETAILNNSLYRDPSQSDRLNYEDTSPEGALCFSMLQCQISNPKTTNVSLPQNQGLAVSIGKDQIAGDGKGHTAEVKEVMCSCITPSLLYVYHCEQCNHIHGRHCMYYSICKSEGHTVALYNAERQHFIPDNQPKQGKDDFLKKHHCMYNSTGDTFLVCHNCQLIHDWSCECAKLCEAVQHNLQPTGAIQPPQEDEALQRHDCLESPEYVIHNTAHDCLAQQHDVLYHQELGETHNTPMQFHLCCIAELLPEIACLACKEFHVSKCPDRWECSSKHKIHPVGTKCVTCLSHEIHILCRYCCLLYCKDCWYKDPMSCKCGKPFDSFNSTPV